jgi:hypothetical protein
MPYSLSWEPRGVVRRYHGDVSIAERLASFEAICRDPRFDELRYCITDYLAAGAFEVTAAATREMAAFHLGPHCSNPRIRIAAVAQRADVVAYVRDFIAQRLAPQPYELFASLAEARRWLGPVAAVVQAEGERA